MIKFVHQYGLYQWFEEHGTELIHADDLDSFRKLLPNGKIFHCDGVDAEFLLLSYGEQRFRVKHRLFKPVPQPSWTIGQSVTVRSNGVLVNGRIADVMWHFQRAEPFYYILVDEKKLSKQYWTNDILAGEFA